MYVNAKVIAVETVPGIREGIKERSGWGEFKYDIFDISYEPLQMPQFTPIQHNNKGKKVTIS
jgi:hypothetical protein